MNVCGHCKEEGGVKVYHLPMYNGVDLVPLPGALCDSCALDLSEMLADWQEEPQEEAD